MLVEGESWRPIRLADDGWGVEIIDQTKLPHVFTICRLESLEDAAAAISDMLVRGAPLIGATAAYGMALAMRRDPGAAHLQAAQKRLRNTRPTAVNLNWALERMLAALLTLAESVRADRAYALAAEICEEDVSTNSAIGDHGLELIEEIWNRKEKAGRVNILTHCNAGWLATVDWGTATAPIYKAKAAGIPVHVWVDETRPRNQGAGLTAWELNKAGVDHSVIVDNAGGHVMQKGLVDLCITGTDRTTARGDVCNKIGTYLKALAAEDCGVPFYVALPGPTIDWRADDGLRDIPIEERDASEVAEVAGRLSDGRLGRVSILPEGSHAVNYAFDVTPARLVTGLITERGVCPASREGLCGLYPERAGAREDARA
jgi:methylthioribose-1-phosphate isomerase